MMQGSGSFPHGFGNSMMMSGHAGMWQILPMICQLILIIIVAVVAVILLRRHGKKVHFVQKQQDTALEILRERYANGEIDTEEYDRRKQDLSV